MFWLFVYLFSCLFMFVTRLFFLASLDNMLTTPNKEMFFFVVKFFFVKSFICFFRHYPQFLSLAGLQNHLPSFCWRLLLAPFCSSGTLTQLQWSHPTHWWLYGTYKIIIQVSFDSKKYFWNSESTKLISCKIWVAEKTGKRLVYFHLLCQWFRIDRQTLRNP